MRFKQIGRGNPTLSANLGKLNYMCKGVDPNEAKELGIRRVSQGPIYGKRVFISQDIHRTARHRYAEASAHPLAAGEAVLRA